MYTLPKKYCVEKNSIKLTLSLFPSSVVLSINGLLNGHHSNHALNNEIFFFDKSTRSIVIASVSPITLTNNIGLNTITGTRKAFDANISYGCLWSTIMPCHTPLSITSVAEPRKGLDWLAPIFVDIDLDWNEYTWMGPVVASGSMRTGASAVKGKLKMDVSTSPAVLQVIVVPTEVRAVPAINLNTTVHWSAQQGGGVPLRVHGSLDVSGSGAAVEASLDLSSPQSSFSAAASPRALAWWAVPIGGQVEWEVNGASALSVSGSGTYGTAGVSLVSALDYGYSSPTTISATLTPHGIGGWTDALSTSAAVVLTSPPPTPTCTDSIMLCSYLSDGDCDGAKSRL